MYKARKQYKLDAKDNVVMVTDTFDEKTNQGKYDFYPLINY